MFYCKHVNKIQQNMKGRDVKSVCMWCQLITLETNPRPLKTKFQNLSSFFVKRVKLLYLH